MAAFFIVSARDLKRMLAYSSIENMGLIAIGFGIGSPIAIAGAIMQIVAHSVTKPILFFSAGNIVQSYGTRDMKEIRGVGRSMPFTSFMLTAGTLAIVGAPPFAVFVGELTLLSGAVGTGMYWTAAAMIVLLAIVFAGFVRNVFPMMTGDAGRKIDAHASFSRHAPLAVLLVASLFLGLFMPDTVKDWLENILSCMGVSL